MTIKIVDNYILFKLDLADKFNYLKDQFNSNKYIHSNIIIDLKSIQIIDYLDFLSSLSEKYKILNKSFIVITSQINEQLHELELALVPTFNEALDLIQLEEIERDLDLETI